MTHVTGEHMWQKYAMHMWHLFCHMCAPVTWVTEYVLLMLTMQLKFMQLNKNRTSPYDADKFDWLWYFVGFWTVLFQVTTPKVSRVKDDPESPDMFGLDQV